MIFHPSQTSDLTRETFNTLAYVFRSILFLDNSTKFSYYTEVEENTLPHRCCIKMTPGPCVPPEIHGKASSISDLREEHAACVCRRFELSVKIWKHGIRTRSFARLEASTHNLLAKSGWILKNTAPEDSTRVMIYNKRFMGAKNKSTEKANRYSRVATTLC